MREPDPEEPRLGIGGDIGPDQPLEPWHDGGAASERDPEPVRHKPRTVRRRRIWRPIPPPEPRVGPGLGRLPWPVRAAEVMRFWLLRLERWLSPGGALRECLRLGAWSAALLLPAAAVLAPAVTSLLEGAGEWSALVAKIALDLAGAAGALPSALIAAAALYLGWRLYLRYRRRGRGPGPGYGAYE